MAETGKIVVLTGPSGVGKSTIADQLAKTFAKGVHLHSDELYWSIKSGFVEPWKPESSTQNGVVIDVMTAQAVTFAMGGYTVVVDGVVGPWYLDRFVGAVSAAGIALHYVVLRPDEDTCVARATGREPPMLIDPEPIRFLYERFRDVTPYEHHVIDTTKLPIADSVGAVAAGIARGAFVIENDGAMEHDVRPWGSYTVLDDASDHKVKRMEVTSGKRLSYQTHARRSEHWFVVRGEGVVVLDGERVDVAPGSAVDVPVGVAHRIESTGPDDLVFIEVQHGDYFGEDDIVRLDDDYGRTP